MKKFISSSLHFLLVIVLISLFLFLWVSPSFGDLPLPTYPECGTPDRPDLCPSDLGERWNLIGYIRDEWKANVREEEWEMGSGLHADEAWQITTGSFDVIVAVLDSGVKWDAGSILNKHFLNRGELPMPQDESLTFCPDLACEDYDMNRDGVFDIRDYEYDPRVSPEDGVPYASHLLDPSDLIAVFSDDVDQDENGYRDDISGWDFMWNDNDPYDDTRYGHGTGEAEDSCAEGEDSHGDIGVCPNCAILNVRVGDSFVVDGVRFGMGVIYAVDMGASVVQEALGSLNNPSIAMDAIEYAWNAGVTIIASAADETAYHHNYPGNNHHTIYTNAIQYNADEEEDATSFLQFNNCTNFGGRLVIAGPNTSCSSGAVGVNSGAAGIIYSAALAIGLEPPLTANEVHQLFIKGADDIDIPESRGEDADPDMYPSRPGWDRYFGYGRTNLRRSVDMIVNGDIPPEADITYPDWFEIVDPEKVESLEIEGYADAKRAGSFSYYLEYAPGIDPDEEEFIVIAREEGLTSPFSGVTGALDVTSLDPEEIDPYAPIASYTLEDTNLTKVDKVNIYTVTLRLRVVDDEGREGEMRKTIYVHSDPDLVEGFPIHTVSSIESSPKLYDMDGDGVFEIIQATSDGEIMVLYGDGTPFEGWPRKVDLLPEFDPGNRDNHLTAPAFTSGGIGTDYRQAVIATPAIHDVDGDGSPEIAVATLNGYLYLYRADGEVMEGFPVKMNPEYSSYTDEDNILDYGFFSSPVLYDLDNDGEEEVTAAGMDQYVYAWRNDGEMMEGWPVLCRYEGDGNGMRNRIISSPAAGDIDGDGVPDIVVGTNETLGEMYGLIYAIHGDGELHEGGAIHEGWPIVMQGLYTDTLPYVGEGSPISPALADIDGDGKLEIASNTITDFGMIYSHDGSDFLDLLHAADAFGAGTNSDEPSQLIGINNGAFGDLDRDGHLDYIIGTAGMNYGLNSAFGYKRIDFDHLLAVWSTKDGKQLEAFPRVMEDLQFFLNPAVADLNDDGYPEAINGSAGFILHAFDYLGKEPEGWPKFTGQWILGSPAVGDIDGDGYLEVVCGTRNGYLYAWNTKGRADGIIEWPSNRHDPANTGNYNTPLPHQEGPPGLEEGCGGCSCDITRGRWGGGLFLLLSALLLAAGRFFPIRDQ